MKCFLCKGAINQGDEVDYHHPVETGYRSKGGTHVEPTHKACHVSYHSNKGDFRSWGRIGGQLSAITRAWAFNLKHVRNNPAYDFDRSYYLAYYAH
jgi:hypothetical protein